jgi:hypothetical protein
MAKAQIEADKLFQCTMVGNRRELHYMFLSSEVEIMRKAGHWY